MASLGRFLVVASLSLGLGVGVGLLVLLLLPQLPLAPNHPLLQTVGTHKPVVMGFLPYWLLAKVDPASLQAINNVTYFGLEINSDGTLVQRANPQELEPGWNKLDKGDFAETVKGLAPSQVERSLLLHLSNDSTISALLSDPTTHAQNMMRDVQPLMKQHGFTDLNLDIESFKTASPAAQVQMVTFLREVRKQIDEKKIGTLTTELTVASLVKEHLLDPVVVGEVSDRVVLMAYDFTYRDSFVSGPVAPLGGAKENIEYDVIESVKLATQAIPAHKLLLGIPLYGYEWETLSYQPRSAVVPGTGKTATLVRVEELRQTCSECKFGRDEITGTPYVLAPPNEDSSIQQIYYEDEQSIQKKIELAQEYRLGGVALWALGYETAGLLKPLIQYQHTAITQP
jgi:spore germination protein YaaH